MRCCLPVLLLFLYHPPLVSADNPPASLDPRGLPGPIVLVSEGTVSTDARQAFFDLAGKGKARIVVIPTEDDATDTKKAEAALAPWLELKPLSLERLHTLDRKQADDPKFVKPLGEATGVWLSGSHAERLIQTYRGTLVEKELKNLHARGSVIGATIGAASALTDIVGGSDSKTMPGFDILPGFILGKAKGIDAAVTKRPTHVGLGFADHAALVIQRRIARVIGKTPVTVGVAGGAGKPAATDIHEAGSLLDLVQLRRAAANRIAREPFPPAKPPEPVVPRGTLMIVGGGGSTPDMWKRFIEASGGPDSLIVVIPTALEDPLPSVIGEESILKKYGAKNVKMLHTRDPKEADDPKFCEILTKAGGIWFGGGRQWRFVDSYAGTLTEKRCHEVLARGGAIGGSSAGASIQSEFMPRGHPLGNTVMAAEGYEKGLCFLPGCAVDQHFFVRKRTADMTSLMKKYPQYLGIGIDEATAIVVTGSVAEVIGKSKVAVYDTSRKPVGERDYEELSPGDRYDLKKRAKIEK